MKQLVFYTLLTVLFCAGCKSQKPSATTEPITSESAQSSSANTQSPSVSMNSQTGSQPADICRLTVSFISIGEGTDVKSAEMLSRVVETWNSKGKVINQESYPWGREGEVDYCFPLTELNQQEQEQFIAELKSIFEGKNLVQMSENQPYRHKK